MQIDRDGINSVMTIWTLNRTFLSICMHKMYTLAVCIFSWYIAHNFAFTTLVHRTRFWCLSYTNGARCNRCGCQWFVWEKFPMKFSVQLKLVGKFLNNSPRIKICMNAMKQKTQLMSQSVVRWNQISFGILSQLTKLHRKMHRMHRLCKCIQNNWANACLLHCRERRRRCGVICCALHTNERMHRR